MTTFAARSGDGTPMFSRPGKQTIYENIAFKEPHDREAEGRLSAVPEEVQKEQLKIDLKGGDADALKAHMKNELKQQERDALDALDGGADGGKAKSKKAAAPAPSGERGNLSSFRTVPR